MMFKRIVDLWLLLLIFLFEIVILPIQANNNSGILVISELSYMPMENGVENPDLEFIEIYNFGINEIDLEDFSFVDGISFTFPQNSIIEGFGYILVVKDARFFAEMEVDVYEWETGSLNNKGEVILLNNRQGLPAISLVYENGNDWPAATELYNYPLELKTITAVYQNPANWQLSRTHGGTPGKPNTPPVLENLFINEFMAKNDAFITDEHGNYSDYIEIFNGSDHIQNLAGVWFSNDNGSPDLFQLPETNLDLTTILPGRFVLLWADDDTDLGILHMNFKLPSQGGEVLMSTGLEDDLSELDQVSYDALDPDISYGRFPDGSDQFEIFTIPTPGSPNQMMHDKILEDLYINEFVAKFGDFYPDENGNFSDWIEIFNDGDESVNLADLYLTDDLGNLEKHKIPTTDSDLTTIPAKGYLVFRADGDPAQGELHLDFELSSQGEAIALVQKTNQGLKVIDQLSYTQQTEDVSYGRYPDGSNQFEFFEIPTPELPNTFNAPVIDNLFINEFVAVYGEVYPDEFGNFSDWIEIYNANFKSVDIGGLYITDDVTDPYRFQIPSNSPNHTTIPSKGFLVLRADGQPELGPLHTSIRLSSQGESIALNQKYAGSLNIIDQLNYGPQTTDVSYGRLPDGGNTWELFATPTPKASNSGAAVDWMNWSQGAIRLYPNPATDHIVLDFNLLDVDQIEVSLLDIIGHQLWSSKSALRNFVPGANKLVIPLSNYHKGLYYLILVNGDQRAVHKLIKTN